MVEKVQRIPATPEEGEAFGYAMYQAFCREYGSRPSVSFVPTRVTEDARVRSGILTGWFKAGDETRNA